MVQVFRGFWWEVREGRNRVVQVRKAIQSRGG